MKNIASLFLLFASTILSAQNDVIEMADVMRSNGKIYVLVVVILVIFLGLAAYLFWIEKKVDKIDKH